MEKTPAEYLDALNIENPNLDHHQLAKISRILLVEDHRVTEKVTEYMLVSLHCQVDIAVDGKTALELIKQRPYDLVFMDVGLPDMRGDEIARRIRANEFTKSTHLPLIALTAHNDSKIQQACLNAGMNIVLTKPLCREEAAKLLQDFIPGRKKWLAAQQPAPNDEKVFDIDYAKKLLGDNETAIWETLNLFVESLSYEAQKLEEAYRQKNWLAIQAIATKLKGGSSYCGTLRLKSACTQLDEAIEAGLISQATDFYENMLLELKALRTWIKDHHHQ